ncbi:MAG: uracil phosphoribosyltransferase [Caldilineaceae bacterium]|nr:uracil phosphoribosyltransferase [Caldilineaceae bacterium]MCY4090533.1 uracil phosphoribosyltransferase [Caldilineaceae bacterium]MCY4117760.1 uracil phosphoribosyltransferase [Caldilineaceae bacterium]MDE0071413.1 uracil phosphoribosyltransferase [Caldilineaceae bacterium]MDE0183638.1 uracil phosphoribosyltransferase [Caldilineaceae bacterium]
MADNLFVSAHPLVEHKITQLRDQTTDFRQFRSIVAELAMILAYEATADLATQPVEVLTPLTAATGSKFEERVGLVPILRAGLGMVDGMLSLIPQAEVWHLGFYRDEETLQPVIYYNKLPNDLSTHTCFVLDPMLATGGSAVAAVDILKGHGVTRVKFVGLLAAPEGVAALHGSHPDVDVHVAAVDQRLTTADDAADGFPPGFIWPGLGDAGDRQFGTS